MSVPGVALSIPELRTTGSVGSTAFSKTARMLQVCQV